MSFSVGILYSSQEFASFVADNPISAEDFRATFRKFSLARAEDILEVSVKCNWIDFKSDGICRITSRGQEIVQLKDEAMALRLQIRDVIRADEPSWAIKIPNGREEAVRFFPQEVLQCFKEAGLLAGWDQDIIEWWDKLAIATRSTKSELSLVTGRLAERLTMEYEIKRTGAQPRWQSIESNFSGYDVLSQSDKNDTTRRKIEVKGSTLSRKEAFCTVTRNEWRTAELAEDYRFHLWCLKGDPYLLDVSKEQMKSHIPVDTGSGLWESVRVPFRSFALE